MKENPQFMSFVQHLGEFRRCLIHSVTGLMVGTAATLYFSKQLLQILLDPLIRVLPPESYLQGVGVFELSIIYLKTAVLFGLFLALPYIAYQIWRFISPGLYQKEKRMILFVALFSALFFVGGALFGYFFVFPTGFKFAVGTYLESPIRFQPKLTDYFSLSASLLIAFGVAFELPVLILLLARMGLIKYRHLHRFRKYAIILSFVIGGILTPGPDILSQFLMAIPLILLYELGGLAAFVFGKRERV